MEISLNWGLNMSSFRKLVCSSIFLVSFFFPQFSFSEPLQNDLFVVMTPNGIMGKSPLYPVFKVADRTDPAAAKIYDAAKADPKYREVLLMYQRAQTETMKRFKEKLISEGKSKEEVEKLSAAKADPIYLIIKDGKATPYMQSGSAFIQTYKNGKLTTDFQYICPKVSIFKQWEGFQSKPNQPFSESERREFINLVSHETSHAIMKELYGYIPKGINPLAAWGHWEGKMSTPQLAFTEGYAEFMGAWFSGSESYDDPKYTKDIESGMPKTQRENKKTEGVVASIMWDIAKGDNGLKDGMEKIHKVLRGKRPWTIEGFSKGFKEMYPNDSRAIDSIMSQNLVPTAESLPMCWYNLKSDRTAIKTLEQSFSALSWFKNPIKKTKAWWALRKARSNYEKRLERYQTLYGFNKGDLTSPNPPPFKPATPKASSSSDSSASPDIKSTVTTASPNIPNAQNEYDAAYKEYTGLASKGAPQEAISAAAARMKEAKAKLESLKSQSR